MAHTRTSLEDSGSSTSTQSPETGGKARALKIAGLVLLSIAGLAWSGYVVFGSRASEVVIVPTSPVENFRHAASAALFGDPSMELALEKVSISVSEDGAMVLVAGRVKTPAVLADIEKRLGAIQPAAPFKVEIKIGI